MNPPKEQIDRMLADGSVGIMTSIVCLGAAVAVKRGESPEDVKVESPDQPLTEEEIAGFKDLLRRSYDLFRHASPAELERAIALYTAHLKAAGYNIEAGQDHCGGRSGVPLG